MPGRIRYSDAMDERWERLFADLETQRIALPDEDEIAALIEAERSAITLDDRLTGSIGTKLEVVFTGGTWWSGVLQFVGDGWVLLRSDRRDQIVNLVQTASIGPLGAPRPAADRRPSLKGALRRLVGVNADVYAHSRHSGVVHFVGADHLDVRNHKGSLTSIRLAELTTITLPAGVLSDP